MFTLPRRRFLQVSAGAIAAMGSALMADEPPIVTDPRATSGDSVHEPDWDEKLTLVVGHPASAGSDKAQLLGADERVLQAAVDSVARFGGGTVQILPGTFKLRNAVYLASNVRILGSGDDTILFKEPSIKTKLAADSDWFDQEITLEDPKGFRVGDGICLRTKNPHNGSMEVAKRTLVARSGNRFKLDRALRQNFWLMGETTVSTLFPILSGENVSNFAIENIALDGNKAQNENLDGNYAGCVFVQDCSRMVLRNVTARNNNGDGLSWQICHDVLVENCRSHDHAGLGLHPGSGSQRPIMRGNVCRGNDIGIFFCWGVKFGLAERNRCEGNRVGISIGHRDNFNVIVENDVVDSRDVGVLFRPERGPAFAPHRNRVERNRVTNSGGEKGIAVDVQGATEKVILAKNELRETRGPAQRIGVRLGAQTGPIELADNSIEGFATAIQDLRKS